MMPAILMRAFSTGISSFTDSELCEAISAAYIAQHNLESMSSLLMEELRVRNKDKHRLVLAHREADLLDD